jgi:lipopolysaccharide export system permease protein
MKMSFLLDRYLARMFIGRFVMLLIGLSTLIVFLDLLANADEVLEAAAGDAAALFRYTALRLPTIMSETVTFAVLLAALMTLGALSRHQELVALRSVGVSQFKLFAMLLPASFIIVVPQFFLNDQLVPHTIYQLRAWGVGEYGEQTNGDDDSPVTWVREGADIIRVRYVQIGEQSLSGVTIFRRGSLGNVIDKISAERAVYVDGAWTLYETKRFSVTEGTTTYNDSLYWDGQIHPSLFASLSAHPRELTWRELKRFVDDQSLGNRPQYYYATWLHKKVAGPFGSLVMLLIAVPLAQRFRPDGSSAPMFIVGVAIGFLYFVLDSWSFTTGEVGLIPPLVAAWTPNLIMSTIAGAIAFQFERH